MAQAAGYVDTSGVEVPQPTKVNEVCQKWMVHEDSCFANRLQSNEFEQKYDLNRFNRRTVRTDIPVARVVQSEEEIRQQQEQMEQLQRNREITQADEAMAAKFREQELQEAELVRKKR
ncbi:hypothetical protein LSAT2_012572 [Lamellibrachia satsuma]|nr:hypothetical protein LSAT2_012572 [Lamellibrachia satsuma]